MGVPLALQLLLVSICPVALWNGPGIARVCPATVARCRGLPCPSLQGRLRGQPSEEGWGSTTESHYPWAWTGEGQGLSACLPSQGVLIFLEVGILGWEAGMFSLLSAELAMWPWAGHVASLGSGVPTQQTLGWGCDLWASPELNECGFMRGWCCQRA